MGIGLPELAVILIFALLLFGGKRIPELAKALGRASYEYKKAKQAVKEEAQELRKEIEASQEKPQEYKLQDNVKNPEV